MMIPRIAKAQRRPRRFQIQHGFDIVEKFIRNIVDFHHGKFYLNPVPFEKVFSPWPRIQRARM